MKKMIKRTSALAISAFMAAQYIPFSAVAYTTTTCDLTIHPYVLNQTDYDNAKGSSYVPTGKTADETNISTTLGIATAENATMTFNITRVTDTGAAHSDTSHNLTGVRSATDLPDGYYKITPANKTDTDARFTDAESFIIQIPVPDSGSVNRDVHIYPKFTENNDNDTTETPGQETPTSGDTHNVTLTKKDNSSTPVAVPGATYKLYYKDAAGKWVAGSATYTTNENGVITVTGLPLGKYYFVEQSAPTGYLLDQEPIAFTIDGATAATVSPVNDKDLTVQKTIANDGAGTVYNWVITADVPSKPENLLSYTITDTYSGLSSTEADITVSIAGMTAGTDYTVNKSTAGTIIIALTSTGIGKLSGTSFDINVSTKLAASATAATNSASINYAYAYDPDTDPDTDPDKDDIIDDANIPDPDPTNPTNPDNPTPKDYPTPGGTPDPENPYTDRVIPGTFTISNVNGSSELGGAAYEIKDASGNSFATPITATDNADDATTNPKIAVVSNLAPGHYKIYQTVVDSDHLLNQVPKDVYVGKDGNIYTDSACTDQYTSNQVQFINEPISTTFSLPFTGTTATIIFTVTGLILMAGTLFFIIILKKRDDDDEEEQENN